MSRTRKLYLSELIERLYNIEPTLITLYVNTKIKDSLGLELFKQKYKLSEFYNKQVLKYRVRKKYTYIEMTIFL